MAGQLYLHVIRSPRYRGYMCEIAPYGVSKWSGVQWIARGLDIPESAICAVGDDVNDLPMIQGVGLGVAMGNAPPNVQAAAKSSDASARRGWLSASRRLLLNEA